MNSSSVPFYGYALSGYITESNYCNGMPENSWYPDQTTMGYSYVPTCYGPAIITNHSTTRSTGNESASPSLLGDFPTIGPYACSSYPQYFQSSPDSVRDSYTIQGSASRISANLPYSTAGWNDGNSFPSPLQNSPLFSSSQTTLSSVSHGAPDFAECSSKKHEQSGDSGENESKNPDILHNHPSDTPVNRLLRLARYNKARITYDLLNERGPAHMKVFTAKVTLIRFGKIEEYWGEGSTIKVAQHNAASKALQSGVLPKPPEKTIHREPLPSANASPVTRLNTLAIKMRTWAVYTDICSRTADPWSFEGTTWNTTVTVAGKEFVGFGASKVCSRSTAAQHALDYFDFEKERREREALTEPSSNLSVERTIVKSPITRLYETARRVCLDVSFEEVSADGLPHCLVHYVRCLSGEMEAIGKGASKKLARNDAAEQMLKQFQENYPAFTDESIQFKNPNKSKKVNIVKVNKVRPEYGQNINPVSRLHQVQQAKNAPDPVLECSDISPVGTNKEFTVTASIPGFTATGSGPNKRLAKRFAAENLLKTMGHQTKTVQPQKPTLRPLKEDTEEDLLPGVDRKVTFELDVPEDGDKQNGRVYRKRFSKKPQPAHLYPKDNVQEVLFEASPTTSNVRPGRTIVPGILSRPQNTSPDREVNQCNVGEISALAKRLLTTRRTDEKSSETSTSLALLEHLCRVVNLTLKKDGFSKQGPHAQFVTVLTVAEPVQSIGCGNGATEEQALESAALNLLTVVADHGGSTKGQRESPEEKFKEKKEFKLDAVASAMSDINMAGA